MFLRRAFFGWLMPAVLVLPAWLIVGWGLFGAGGWAFLGVILVAVPAVLIGQLVVALMIRARPTVRVERALSWQDVLGVTVWHGLVIAFGCYLAASFVAVLLCATIAFLALFWSSLAQLWRDTRQSLTVGFGPIAPERDPERATRPDPGPNVIVVRESDSTRDAHRMS